eukprot:8378149-Ditylum_brightwellii.AAC.1
MQQLLWLGVFSLAPMFGGLGVMLSLHVGALYNIANKLTTLLPTTLIQLSPDEIAWKFGIRVDALNWLPEVKAENTNVNGVT